VTVPRHGLLPSGSAAILSSRLDSVKGGRSGRRAFADWLRRKYGSADALRAAAAGAENLVPFILDCARAYCTLYEIRAALEDVFGAYREPVFF